jgi:hypothetical protein
VTCMWFRTCSSRRCFFGAVVFAFLSFFFFFFFPILPFLSSVTFTPGVAIGDIDIQVYGRPASFRAFLLKHDFLQRKHFLSNRAPTQSPCVKSQMTFWSHIVLAALYLHTLESPPHSCRACVLKGIMTTPRMMPIAYAQGNGRRSCWKGVP